MAANGNFFNHRKIIGFEYVKKRKKWRFDALIVDEEVLAVIGRDALQKVPITNSYFPQGLHLRQVLVALALHDLDGGSVCEKFFEGNRYRAEITVERRKPGSKKGVSP